MVWSLTTCLFSSVVCLSPSFDRASLWPKQPIWVGRLRVVSRGNKCAVLLEHTDKEGLFASCPIQAENSVEPTVDSSRYFVLRLSDGKGRHALIGLGFNDRAQAFDFKVSLQDHENHNREGAPAPADSGSKSDYSIPQGGSIHVTFGSKPKKHAATADVSSALSDMRLDAPPAKGADGDDKEKKKKKKKAKEGEQVAADQPNFFAPSAAASSVVQPAQANIIDFGFGDFDPLAAPQHQPAASTAPRRASIVDPFGASSAADPFSSAAQPGFGKEATPFDTPFDDTPSDWVKF